MTHLSDDALWAVAGSTANEDKQALYDVLLERQEALRHQLKGRVRPRPHPGT